MTNIRVCVIFIRKQLTHGDCRMGAVKWLKNLAIEGVLIRGSLEVGFSCFCERVFSFVPTYEGSQWPPCGVVS